MCLPSLLAGPAFLLRHWCNGQAEESGAMRLARLQEEVRADVMLRAEEIGKLRAQLDVTVRVSPSPVLPFLSK